MSTQNRRNFLKTVSAITLTGLSSPYIFSCRSTPIRRGAGEVIVARDETLTRGLDGVVELGRHRRNRDRYQHDHAGQRTPVWL